MNNASLYPMLLDGEGNAHRRSGQQVGKHLVSDLPRTCAYTPHSYRGLLTKLLVAAREETPDLDDMLPSRRVRFQAIGRALVADDVEEAGLRNHVAAFVRLVERCYGWQRGLPVTLNGPVGEVYREAVYALRCDGVYPVLKRRSGKGGCNAC